MIAYVNGRMQEWAEWSYMRMDGFYGIGGGGFYYDEPMPTRERGYLKLPSSERCLETELAVAWLRVLERPRLGELVVLHYRDHPSWSAAIRADFLSINLRTYWRRMETAHAMLLCYFFDRAYGLVPPQVEALRLERRGHAVSDHLTGVTDGRNIAQT